MVFAEVKSAYVACSGVAGTSAHVHDFVDIVQARKGRAILGIKTEFERVFAQKLRLSLVSKVVHFKGFLDVAPDLLIVLVDLDDEHPSILGELDDIRKTTKYLGRRANIRLLGLKSPQYSLDVTAKRIPVSICFLGSVSFQRVWRGLLVRSVGEDHRVVK